MMTVNVEQLIGRVIGVEGGYSNHPSDRGGATKWGVTEQTARAFGYPGDMRVFPRETAVEIYRKRYWTDPRLDRVAEQCPALAAELFDTGVNMGPGTAVKFLQRALNVLNRRGRDWPDMAVDGALGSITLNALATFIEHRGAAGETALIKACDALQCVRYIELCEARAANEDFAYGWIANRVGLGA